MPRMCLVIIARKLAEPLTPSSKESIPSIMDAPIVPIKIVPVTIICPAEDSVFHLRGYLPSPGALVAVLTAVTVSIYRYIVLTFVGWTKTDSGLVYSNTRHPLPPSLLKPGPIIRLRSPLTTISSRHTAAFVMQDVGSLIRLCIWSWIEPKRG